MRRGYFILILVIFSSGFIFGCTKQALADDADCVSYGGTCQTSACVPSTAHISYIFCTDRNDYCCASSSSAPPATGPVSGPSASGPSSTPGSVGGPPFTGVGTSGSGSGSGPMSCPPGTALDGGTCIPTNVGLSTGSVSTRFGSIFSFPAICFSGPVLCVLATFLSWILTVLGVVTVISFVIAGLQYMLSLGDPKSVETAKAHMKWSIVGLIVALSGVIAILQIDSWLGV